MTVTHKCVQVDKLADIRTQQSLHTQEMAMLNEKLADIKSEIKDMNDKMSLFLDMANKIYATREYVESLDKKVAAIYKWFYWTMWIIAVTLIWAILKLIIK